MARATDAKKLAKMIDSLRAQRRDLLDRLAGIDSTFEALGIKSDGRAGKATRKAAAGGKPGRRRKRRSFPISGDESVLAFVKKHGKPNAAEVNKHWNAEGRGGKADNTLSRLVKHKQLKRVAAKGERGGRYVAA